MPTATSSDQTPVADTASEAASAPRLPLTGLVVLDFGQIFQGPYATLLLADAGADVIKIEPLHGEPLRRRAAPGKTSTLPFAMLNQNKRGITLNLKHPRGRELLFDMVRRADVLLENFSPGTMDDLGVGWSVLHPLNPRLIYATGTGFGISGPDRDNLAMDLTIQAVSGLIATTGFPDGPPVKAGPAVVDFLSGIHLYAATITALFERERTGIGRLVEVAALHQRVAKECHGDPHVRCFLDIERASVSDATIKFAGSRDWRLRERPYYDETFKARLL
jgi:crotonobetainyl-CoA:carnitine CoA-transferase CaiB-like acyl-CoA transferase